MAAKRTSVVAALVSLVLSGCPLTDDYYVSLGIEGIGGTGRGGSGLSGESQGSTNADGTTGGSGLAGGSSANLIANRGFENGTTGWAVLGATAFTTITASQQLAHGGTFSLLISGRTLAYQGPLYSLTGLATSGNSYRAAVWVHLPTGVVDTAGFNVTVRLLCDSGSYEYLPWVSDATVSSLLWTELTGTNSLSGCASGVIAAVDLYVEGPASAAAFYIDDVVFAPADS